MQKFQGRRNLQMQKRIFTSESVTEGHPDKVCDQISDGVLDAILAQDPKARVACECCATTGMVMVMGEISTECYVDIPHVARDTICRIGYDKPESGFNGHTCAVLTAIDEQSGDIAMGVNSSFDDADTLGAGDQGMMFGFACSETPELMPAPITYAQQLAMKLSAVRKSGELDWLRPDGKSQVSVQYGEDGSVERIDTVVVSTQHADSVPIKDLREAVIERVIRPTLPARLIDGDTKFYVNPTGRFVVGGPAADSGLTGRKIIVDTYGGYAAHGGGAFSGKDPTKVDRSAAYMARYVAKNLVAAGLAAKCQIELAYAIGVAHPVSVLVDTFGTGRLSDARLSELVSECFDLRPAAIIRSLDLRRPIYQQVAAYGHFGRADLDLPWEKTDAVERILARA
jgi:S-adenosylmethionine synthetase